MPASLLSSFHILLASMSHITEKDSWGQRDKERGQSHVTLVHSSFNHKMPELGGDEEMIISNTTAQLVAHRPEATSPCGKGVAKGSHE